MKFGWNVLHNNMHQLTNSNFLFDVTLSRLWRLCWHMQSTPWWFNMNHLPGVYAAALLHCWQFLIYRTFILVVVEFCVQCLSSSSSAADAAVTLMHVFRYESNGLSRQQWIFVNRRRSLSLDRVCRWRQHYASTLVRIFTLWFSQ